MRYMRIMIASFWVVPSLGMAETPGAALDCAKYANVPLQDSIKHDPKAIHECMILGWDPPKGWRPSEGKGSGINAGGAGGVNIGTVQAPSMPPWRSAAQSGTSIPGSSGASSGGSFKFPPWDGWPFGTGGSSSSSSGGSSGGSSGACPTSNDDADATFGVKTSLTTSATLECGGAAPLTTYELSLSQGADTLLITEHGYFHYWIYKKEGNAYKLISPANAQLPNKLCDGTALKPLVAQMISFSSNAHAIALRLQGDKESDPLVPIIAPDEPEKRIAIQQSGGKLVIPDSCIEPSAYNAAAPLGDLVFDTVMSAGCEAPPEVCQANGLSVTPTALPDCQLAVLYPSGTRCTNKTQVILLDRPNLIYPSGSTTRATPVAGLHSLMLASVEGSMIQTKNGWIVRLGDTGRSFTLPQGATVGLADGNRLRLNASSTLSGNGKMTMPNGGVLLDAAGNTLQTYAENTSITANVIKPLVMKINQSIAMPPGYEVPSSPVAKVRQPITNP